MTATFGKLQNETLTLKPGLNIIEAPNEWGKSTWCAFLLAMFYGIDTRAKTTKTALSDKEHYAPWSGRPMSGRIRLSIHGRDITIERNTKGRIPMGQFSAYETDSGLPIPQLTAENCGEKLLGVEQSVFRRAGFVRLSDLPVTKDDALRRRLNALVTTGDESEDGEHLAKELKNLKNRCRYNKTGLLPQAEQELSEAQNALKELKNLREQSQILAHRAEDQNIQYEKLQNHLTHLQNQEASADAARVREAQKQAEETEKKREELEVLCKKLPTQAQLYQKQERVKKLSRDLNELLEKQRALPAVPAAAALVEMSQKNQAEQDRKTYERMELNFTIVWVLAGICCGAAAVLCFALSQIWGGILCILAALAFAAGGLYYRIVRQEKLQELQDKYGDLDPAEWGPEIRKKEPSQNEVTRTQLQYHLEELKKQQTALCGENTEVEALQKIQSLMRLWDHFHQAEKDADQAKKYLDSLMAMAKKSRNTDGEDDLYLSREETLQQMEENRKAYENCLSEIGKYQGRMETLGTENQLLAEIQTSESRIRKLEEYYEALCIAQANLEEAAAELQRRFAPRITRRAQELMWRMTGGRYERLTMEEDFSINTAAEAENILRSVLWRSEGTMDQLYLSLRLAVSEALTPEAPILLDDALLRFDERRLQKALEILNEEQKQVILFTCQNRERTLFPQAAVQKA